MHLSGPAILTPLMSRETEKFLETKSNCLSPDVCTRNRVWIANQRILNAYDGCRTHSEIEEMTVVCMDSPIKRGHFLMEDQAKGCFPMADNVHAATTTIVAGVATRFRGTRDCVELVMGG